MKKKIYLLEEPKLESACNQDDVYIAVAVDEDLTQYKVVWDIIDHTIKEDEIWNPEDDCDWENPAIIRGYDQDTPDLEPQECQIILAGEHNIDYEFEY